MTARFFLALVFLLAGAMPAFALKISPFKASLDVTDPNATQLFRIENNSAEPAAVQVSVTTWRILPDGTEQNEDAEGDFIVFPAQVVLQPHESRAVRVQYAGPPGTVEKAYRLVAEQLPVRLQDTPGAGSAVRFMLRFKAALYVVPGKVKSEIAVRDVENSGCDLAVTLVNKGTGHSLIRDPELDLRLKNGGGKTLSGDMLAKLAGENIHAGSERRFGILLPPELCANVESAALQFKPAF